MQRSKPSNQALSPPVPPLRGFFARYLESFDERGNKVSDKQPPAHFSLSDNPITNAIFQSIRQLIRYPNTRNF